MSSELSLEEFKKTREYKQNLEKVLWDVRNNQHLRFINSIYRTFEVCCIAVINNPEYDVYAVPEEIRKDVVNAVLEKYPRINRWLPKEFQREEEPKSVQYGKLLDLLSDERANSYEDWLKVGLALHHSFEGSEDGLSLWISFSKRSKKFVGGECAIRWLTFENVENKNDYYTLCNFAYNDNPEGYNQYISKYD